MAIKEEQGTPSRPGRKGYVTTTFTGDDIKKARGMLDKQAAETRDRHNTERSTYKNKVRNYRGRVKMVSDQSAQQIKVMQDGNARLYPKGALASRSCTVNMPAYIKNGRVVREGDPDY